MANMKLTPAIREFAELMELYKREHGLHDDKDKSYLYARGKEGLSIIADNILTDSDALGNNCANMGLVMMMLAQETTEGVAE